MLIRTQVYIPQSSFLRLKALASTKKTKWSKLYREAIDEYLKKTEAKKYDHPLKSLIGTGGKSGDPHLWNKVDEIYDIP